jgi:predicted outer membrane protein
VKAIAILAVASVTMITAAGCDRRADDGSQAEDRVGGSIFGGNDVERFAEQAAAANLAEISLGQLAASKAQSQAVKDYAQTMIQEHTAAQNELSQAVAGLNVQLPTRMDEKHQELHDRLSQLEGADFDREYVDAMIDGHEEVADLLEERAEPPTFAAPEAETPPDTGASTGEPDVAGHGDEMGRQVNAWAAKTLPSVRVHLERAQQIQQQLDR